jgi:hypothetical protein
MLSGHTVLLHVKCLSWYVKFVSVEARDSTDNPSLPLVGNRIVSSLSVSEWPFH